MVYDQVVRVYHTSFTADGAPLLAGDLMPMADFFLRDTELSRRTPNSTAIALLESRQAHS